MATTSGGYFLGRNSQVEALRPEVVEPLFSSLYPSTTPFWIQRISSHTVFKLRSSSGALNVSLLFSYSFPTIYSFIQICKKCIWPHLFYLQVVKDQQLSIKASMPVRAPHKIFRNTAPRPYSFLGASLAFKHSLKSILIRPSRLPEKVKWNVRSFFLFNDEELSIWSKIRILAFSYVVFSCQIVELFRIPLQCTFFTLTPLSYSSTTITPSLLHTNPFSHDQWDLSTHQPIRSLLLRSSQSGAFILFPTRTLISPSGFFLAALALFLEAIPWLCHLRAFRKCSWDSQIFAILLEHMALAISI